MNLYISNFNLGSDAVKHLISINILVYAATFVFAQYKLENMFSLYHFMDDRFEIYQLFTHMFIHSKRFFLHIVFNMLALFMFGGLLENLLGMKKFLMIYFLSGVSAAVLQLIFNTSILYSLVHTLDMNQIKMMLNNLDEDDGLQLYSIVYSPMMGASGAVSGIVGAFARFFPKHKIFLLPFPFPIAVRKALVIFILGSLISSLLDLSPGIAHFAHIGGILCGYIMGYYLAKLDNNIY
ncbi:rhomboid family intramembrane serine protease [Blattabacterium cuenoti]|uniref:rhomboid family intramembrane serine protease n=1 Tax=Blattabacterium cuenoti TaxID=1653831 RepID=UPI00163C35D4|nr:rhomboid family intramembrane serine protease [Blattabacterium cuenoti]